MQEQQEKTTSKQADNFFWMAVSPLGLFGLPRYFYEGNIGNMRDILLMYFVLIGAGQYGIVLLLKKIVPNNMAFSETAIQWAIWLLIAVHISNFITEAKFFYELRNKLKGT